MADNQAQKMTLTGGNDATNKYVDYYNQIRSQLSSGYTPERVQAQVIEAPEKVQAQLIEAPEKIQAERINVDRMGIDQFASELDKYFQPYLQNAIKQRQEKTAQQRAQADADAYRRGMGSSTYLTDAKLGLEKQEASDLMGYMSDYLSQLGQRALSAWDANEGRWLTAEQQNVANALTAAQQNAYYDALVKQYNADAMMKTDEYNTSNLINIALQNAANKLAADELNAKLGYDWQQTLEQLAWARAGQMYNTNPVVETRYVPGGIVSILDDSYQKAAAAREAVVEARGNVSEPSSSSGNTQSAQKKYNLPVR